jgi:hypothetical protein
VSNVSRSKATGNFIRASSSSGCKSFVWSPYFVACFPLISSFKSPVISTLISGFFFLSHHNLTLSLIYIYMMCVVAWCNESCIYYIVIYLTDKRIVSYINYGYYMQATCAWHLFMDHVMGFIGQANLCMALIHIIAM